MQPRLSERGLVALELLIERPITTPQLLHEQMVEHASRLDQLDQGLLVAGRQARCINLQGCARKALGHFLELGIVRY